MQSEYVPHIFGHIFASFMKYYYFFQEPGKTDFFCLSFLPKVGRDGQNFFGYDFLHFYRIQESVFTSTGWHNSISYM